MCSLLFSIHYDKYAHCYLLHCGKYALCYLIHYSKCAHCCLIYIMINMLIVIYYALW